MSDIVIHKKHIYESKGYTWTPVYVSSFIGEIEVAVCWLCGFESFRCTHKRCTWIGPVKDEHLICDLCGEDCT